MKIKKLAAAISSREALSLYSLAAITAGLYLERPSLALIVPGAIVFTALAWSHIRGTDSTTDG